MNASTIKRLQGKRRGVALIMALYITAIVFALATFFIADQINKRKNVANYEDSKQAVQAANVGLNILVNYLGGVSNSGTVGNNWADAVLIGPPGATSQTAICGETRFSYPPAALSR